MKIQVSLSAAIMSHKDGSQPKNPDAIFVFGSNTEGQHWGGAAAAAFHHYGAKWGKSFGASGKSFAIPSVEVTLDRKGNEKSRRTLELAELRAYVKRFRRYVTAHPDLEFFLTRVGCSIAGLKDEDVGPMFGPPQPNVNYPKEWVKLVKAVP